MDSALSDGVFGSLLTGDVLQVFISVERNAPNRFRILGWRGRFAILGRDVQDLYHIALDGPNQTLAIAR